MEICGWPKPRCRGEDCYLPSAQPTLSSMLRCTDLAGEKAWADRLARMASESRDPVVRNATRYFRHGERLGLWRSFLERLEASRIVREHPERAERGALNAFGAFEAASA